MNQYYNDFGVKLNRAGTINVGEQEVDKSKVCYYPTYQF